MSTGAALGRTGLYVLWGHRGPWTRARLQVGTAAASLYWITQLSATLYPRTALFDRSRSAPDEKPPRLRGPQTVMASATLALNVLADGLEGRRLAKR